MDDEGSSRGSKWTKMVFILLVVIAVLMVMAIYLSQPEETEPHVYSDLSVELEEIIIPKAVWSGAGLTMSGLGNLTVVMVRANVTNEGEDRVNVSRLFFLLRFNGSGHYNYQHWFHGDDPRFEGGSLDLKLEILEPGESVDGWVIFYVPESVKQWPLISIFISESVSPFRLNVGLMEISRENIDDVIPVRMTVKVLDASRTGSFANTTPEEGHDFVVINCTVTSVWHVYVQCDLMWFGLNDNEGWYGWSDDYLTIDANGGHGLLWIAPGGNITLQVVTQVPLSVTPEILGFSDDGVPSNDDIHWDE